MSEQSNEEIRELLFIWSTHTLDVLVPKIRGKGFLKVPLGHHPDSKLSDIEMAMHCDICGLDGYLSLDCGLKVTCYPEKRKKFQEKALPLVAKRFRCPGWREITHDEFWRHLGLAPLNPSP